jgi:hypothetical protein
MASGAKIKPASPAEAPHREQRTPRKKHMPTPGFSLVGFMEQNRALHHLKTDCVPEPKNRTDAELFNDWVTARGKLGFAIAKAGKPDVRPISKAHDAYIQQLKAEPWVQPWLAGPLADSTFQEIEIGPLLALQFTVDAERSDHHCGKLPSVPNGSDLLPVCLPMKQPPRDFITSPIGPGAKSVLIKARNLSLQMVNAGIFDMNFAGYESHLGGLVFQLSFPFVHVVRLNGRCYLHNGFHRAYGAGQAGATHMPCLFRDVATPEQAGIRNDGTTFDLTRLESSNPPTLAHFTQGRAFDVQLRSISRILHVTWSEYVMPDE